MRARFHHHISILALRAYTGTAALVGATRQLALFDSLAKEFPARRAAGRRRVSDDALHACHRPARHAGVVLAGIAERTRFRGRTAAAASAGAHAPLAERAGAEGTRVRRRRVEETAAAVRALGAAQRGDAELGTGRDEAAARGVGGVLRCHALA